MNNFVEIKDENTNGNEEFFKTKNSFKKVFVKSYPNEFYAGFFIRFFSFLLDSIIAGAIVEIVLDPILSITGMSVSLKIYGLLSTLIVLLYFTISTYLTKGQTIGKMVFGLKVVKLNGEDLDFVTVFIREFVGRYIHTYGVLVLLYLITAFTDKKQNLSDLFADTSVIVLSKENAYNLGKAENPIYN